jgi:hypothetical protein
VLFPLAAFPASSATSRGLLVYPAPLALTTSSGRRVQLREVRIYDTTKDYLEGRGIYAAIRSAMHKNIDAQFGAACGRVILWPEGEVLPAFTWFVDLTCQEPFGRDDDFSQLVAVRFSDHLPENLAQDLRNFVNGLDWDANATGGKF